MIEQKQKGCWNKRSFENDPNFMSAIELANFAKTQGIEHSKLPKLKEVISTVKDKVLIFTSYRDSVNVINDTLQKMGIKSEILIGKAGDTGLKQKNKLKSVQDLETD